MLLNYSVVQVQDQTLFMNWKIRREIQNPQIVQQTISLNAKRSTLGIDLVEKL
jgi:hypothetical protein